MVQLESVGSGSDDDGIAHPCIATPGLLVVKATQHAGRGVFATQAIRAGTLIEVSHALLFPAHEYQQHGRHTQLDHYTYVWTKTSEGAVMALALGLGSLFNHAYEAPNVSFILHKPSQTIRYVVARNVEAGDELCISYGSGRMWWEAETAAEVTAGPDADSTDELAIQFEQSV